MLAHGDDPNFGPYSTAIKHGLDFILKLQDAKTGYIGGVKERTAKYILESRFPERVVEKAVQRMLPHGPLGRQQFGNLRVYKGPDHPHAAQQPEVLDVAAMNRKNVRA